MKLWFVFWLQFDNFLLMNYKLINFILFYY